MLGLESFPALLYFFLLFLIPNSPRWLVLKGRRDEAQQILNNINGPQGGEEVMGDIIKSIDGVVVTMENANSIFGEVFGWQPGRDVSVTLVRDGEEVLIEETLTTSYTMGQQLGRNPDITDAQQALLENWLKG